MLWRAVRSKSVEVEPIVDQDSLPERSMPSSSSDGPDDDLRDVEPSASAISRRDFSRVLGAAALGVAPSLGGAHPLAIVSPSDQRQHPATSASASASASAPEDLCFTS